MCLSLLARALDVSDDESAALTSTLAAADVAGAQAAALSLTREANLEGTKAGALTFSREGLLLPSGPVA